MSKNEAMKLIHAAMRTAGYERQPRKIVIGDKVYATHIGWNPVGEYAIIYIPGNWAIPIRNQMRDDLMIVLKAFDPEPDMAYSGVRINIDRIKPVDKSP